MVCLLGVSRLFVVCLLGVSRMFVVCLLGVSGMFLVCRGCSCCVRVVPGVTMVFVVYLE